MLVVTRKKDQRIQIHVGGRRITIQVVRCGPRAVRLGINAPPDASIAREEVDGRRPQLAAS